MQASKNERESQVDCTPVAQAGLVPDPECGACRGYGRFVVGNSGRDDDGNALLWEECDCFITPLDAATAKAVSLAKQIYGEPEYTYYKQRISWHSRDKTHYVPVAPNGHEPITREEWEANSAQAAVNEVERFMGRLKQTYWRYERKQVAPAWREKLLELIPKYPA